MKTKINKLPKSAVEIEVKLNREEFQPYWDDATALAVSGVKIKGFRPGAAPEELARRAIDKNAVFEEAVNEAVKNSLDGIVKENGWSLIDRPEIDLTPDADKGLAYKARIVVFPEVALGDYKKIAKKILGERKKPDVSEEEIEKSLKWLVESRAKIARVSRAATAGDVVGVSFSGFIGGKPVGDSVNRSDRFVLGEGRFMPGFEENLAGKKEGEETKFSLTAPADYQEEDLRGKKIDFEVKISGVFERELPELNDEFAKNLGNFSDFADLKKSVRDGLLAEKEAVEADRLRAAIVNEIVGESKIDLPQIFIDKTIDQMTEEARMFAERLTGGYGEYLKRHHGGSEEKMREALAEGAISKVSADVAMYAVAKAEKLEPSPEETEEETKSVIARGGVQNIDRRKLYDYSYGIIQRRKVFEFLENLTDNK
ncbi:MAG: trigger factor [Parcubacteria group bacterium]|nr:trigger factor [Parcubacteria group bacterium]